MIHLGFRTRHILDEISRKGVPSVLTPLHIHDCRTDEKCFIPIPVSHNSQLDSEEDEHSNNVLEVLGQDSLNNLIDLCYDCNEFQSTNKEDYPRHQMKKHPGRSGYPGWKVKEMGLKTQGKAWEN